MSGTLITILYPGSLGHNVGPFNGRLQHPTSDFDIYLCLGDAYAMGTFLQSVGYMMVGSQGWRQFQFAILRAIINSVKESEGGDSIEHYVTSGIVDIFNFTDTNRSGPIRRIQLIALKSHPVEHILFQFHSTVVMNYFTADMAVSIFPQASFVNRRSFISRFMDRDLPNDDDVRYTDFRVTGGDTNEVPHLPLWVDKYRARGFDIIQKQEGFVDSKLPIGRRFVGDSDCWVIKFNTPYLQGFQFVFLW
ncbi:hypothetical protein JAAARDRAFT_188458 [Jaapia argillacea MUCL 33604]|uniref:Uncharacterized protein n=1 Tax=Jaapia argillacea MUCL 33604 TaxID=933084 RepID=A0A067QNR5_9AGAM|nr:hypothetical protein JAAARDRAFT_188458 [Jaapia argillacea MUCL 33604]